jgi:endonuclease/exonuclease/phosphatase (EEP) superfamily protein YafD
VGATVVSACLLVVLSRYVDLAVVGVPVVQSLGPVAGGAGLLVGVGVAAATRHRVVIVPTAALALLAVVLAVPTLRRDVVAPGPDDLVVLSANLEFGQGDAETIVGLVRARRVDVLVLVEITPDAGRRLAAAGLDTLLPNQVGAPRDGAVGSVIRSRLPMVEAVGAKAGVPGAPGEPAALVSTSGGEILVQAAHPWPPTPGSTHAWRDGLSGLAQWMQTVPPDRPVVMLGDFNAAQTHPGFRALTDLLTDAHRGAGLGWVRTWPMDAAVPPFIQLDHVLTRGFGVVEAGVEPILHSDHAAVWARLRPPG